MKNKKITAFLLLFFFALSAGFMAYYFHVSREQPKHLPILGDGDHKIRQFSFINQDGKTITNDDIKGKICVVEYFFTTCKGICPKMNENMSQVYQAFKGNKSVMILSHTVDPKRDTVGAMKEYSLRFEANPNQWEFLTGDKKELYDMARYSYLVTAVDTTIKDINQDFIHTDRFVLVDGTGHIRGQYEGTNLGSINQLIGDIKTLLVEK